MAYGFKKKEKKKKSPLYSGMERLKKVVSEIKKANEKSDKKS